jgi:UDP-N-acetylglucosamine--N-acetylmuramyl-(pentapeptide) pyrophosphoryl-undecaprenol N-acetylglucosamine transferase
MKEMRILLTGGGTGGHIYPLVAVAETLIKISPPNLRLKIYYLGPNHPLNEEFRKRGIRVYNLASSKLRRYFSLENFLDVPKFFLSICQALFRLYFLMPDVVFSKGGPGALAVILAAKFYLIPIIIHESDSNPGLTNRLSAKFAARIGIAFAGAAEYFPPTKTAFLGNPLRLGLLTGEKIDIAQAKRRINFDPREPLILILGGSQGSAAINFFVLDNLEVLLKLGQIYHQTGEKNFAEARQLSENILKNLGENYERRYRITPILDTDGIKDALLAADLVLSRAGAGAIYEIAAFGKPSILVPLNNAANDHQKKNAYEYASTGAAIVIEESNFKLNIVLVQLKKILEDKEQYQSMAEAARAFFKPQAAEIIAREILKLGGM